MSFFIPRVAWIVSFIPVFRSSFRFAMAINSTLDMKQNITHGPFRPYSWPDSSGYTSHMIGSDDWFPMTAAESLDIFSLREVCSLSLDFEACASLPGLSVSSCEAQERGIVHSNRRCSNNRGYFLRHKTHELGKNWFGELIQRMIKMGDNTILLVGDSITSGMFNDAFCSSVRLRLHVRDFSKLPRIHARMQGLAYIYENNEKYNNVTDFTIQVIHLIDTMEVVDDVLNITSNPKLNMKGNIVMIYNVGLHVHRDEEMRKMLNLVIPLTMNFAKMGHAVFFRETSAQHFDSATGSYEDADVRGEIESLRRKNITTPMSMMGEKLGLIEASKSLRHYDVIDRFSNPDLHLSCKPIQSKAASKKQNWRNQMVHEMYRQLDPQKTVHIIPYYHMTAARYDFHVAAWGDCTHFCFSPTMWSPVWYHILRSYTVSKKTPKPRLGIKGNAET